MPRSRTGDPAGPGRRQPPVVTLGELGSGRSVDFEQVTLALQGFDRQVSHECGKPGIVILWTGLLSGGGRVGVALRWPAGPGCPQ